MSRIQRLQVKVDARLHGMRIDQALAAAGLDLSRRKIRMIIDVGGVYLNRKRIRVASRLVEEGDFLQVEYSPETLVRARKDAFEFTDTDILYSDDGLIAVNKPAGLPSQETLDQSVMHVKPCLLTYLRKIRSPVTKVVLVHRLDKETSGVLLLATDDKTATKMTDLFRSRDVHKVYMAVCWGIPSRHRFEESIGLSDIDRKTGHVRVMAQGGRSAHTKFHVVGENKSLGISLIQCEPLTGRSHQIRVHLEHAGFPIVGDKRYGGRPKGQLPDHLAAIAAHHQMLHARAISFTLAGHAEAIAIEAPYSDPWRTFLREAFGQE